jgi:fructose-specific phosphotransferase system IIC component
MRDDDQDIKLGRGVLFALAVLLVTVMLAFQATGPVNKLAVVANAPTVPQR